MWTTLLSLLLLSGFADASTQLNQDSGCLLTEDEVSSLLDIEARTWTVTNATLETHDLGDIVTCMQAEDRLTLAASRIRPRKKIVISKPLTLSGAVELSPSLTCPEDDALFVVRGVDVVLSNIGIKDCRLSSFSDAEAVVEAADCAEGKTASLQLLSVVFENNVHREGVPALSIQNPECYSVAMDDVEFRSNTFYKSAVLGAETELKNVRLVGNVGGPTDVAIFSFSEGKTRVRNLTADGNEIEVLRAKSGTIDIQSSQFINNRGMSTITTEDTVVSLSLSAFLENSCDGTCGALYLTGGSLDGRSNRFIKNEADQGSGGIYAVHPTSLSLTDVLFESNSVINVGLGNRPYASALSILGDRASENVASIDIKDCVFFDNDAIEGVGGMVVHSWKGNISISKTEFVDNEGLMENFGGALSINRAQDIVASIVDCNFRANAGYRGGGIHIKESPGSVAIRRTNFMSNVVYEDGMGGAVDIDVFGDVKAEFDDVRFEENEGGLGGAVHISNFGVDLKCTECLFRKNFAQDGGALAVGTVEAVTIERSVFEGQKAENEGGAVKLTNPGRSVTFRSTRFVKNKAGNGGAVHGDGGVRPTWTDCEFKDNEAVNQGGAVDIAAIDTVFKDSNFSDNSARYGGAIYASVDDGSYDIQDSRIVGNRAYLGGGAFFKVAGTPSESVVISRTSFERNIAERGGGGFFIDDPTTLKVDCALAMFDDKGGDDGYLASNVDCSFMKDNLANDGYGWEVATSATSYVAFLRKVDLDDDRVSVDDTDRLSIGDVHVIPEWRSGDRLPTLGIVLVDAFLQGPALQTQTVTNAIVNEVIATVTSPDGLISNMMVSNITTGSGEIELGSPFTMPGNYTLRMWIRNDQERDITIKVICRSCVVGEVAALNGWLCLKCEEAHYNIDLNASVCKNCPKNAICDQWGLKPDKDYWIPSPCYPRVIECLCEDACRGRKLKSETGSAERCVVDDREKDLRTFLNNREPSCDLKEEDMQDFLSMECTGGRDGGYEGPLCGSCKEGYGQFELRCFKCLAKSIIVLWLIWNTAWTCFTSAISILGNLHDTGAFEEPVVVTYPEGPSESTAVVPEAAEGDEPLMEASFRLPIESMEQKREIAKRNVTESVKVDRISFEMNASCVAVFEFCPSEQHGRGNQQRMDVDRRPPDAHSQ